MAIITSYNAYFKINSVDLSNRCKKLTVDDGQETREATAFSNTYRLFRPGLGTPSIEATFYNDHTDGSVETTLRGLIGITGTGTSCTARYLATTRTASNPEFYMDAIIDGGLLCLDDTPGEIPEITVKFLPYSTFACYTSAA